MGIGEPLDNFDNVTKAIRIFAEPKGIHFGKRKISISTIGIPSMIRMLKDQNLGVKLSVSLHSADPHKRKVLMPQTGAWSLNELIASIHYFSRNDRYPVTLEYIVIEDFNSSVRDASQLARLIRHINCKVNLIPYNPSPYFKWQPPSHATIEEFKGVLEKQRVFFTSRKPRGSDINASCGQLQAEYNC
jgi:23S rRNA (adenine2503-C2)-methyltransferase